MDFSLDELEESVQNQSIEDVTGKKPMSVRRREREQALVRGVTKAQAAWRRCGQAERKAKLRRELGEQVCRAAAEGEVKRVMLVVDGRGGKRGVKINRAQDANGNTALHVASEMGYVEIVEQMLVKGADTEVANRLGWTALHLAVRNGHLECATVLLEAGASVQRQGGFSETALHIAAYNADQKMIQLLIDQGQGSRVACARQNQFGLTALDAARDHCKGRALRILEDFAADAQAPRSSGK